jgi:hypothetical protein
MDNLCTSMRQTSTIEGPYREYLRKVVSGYDLVGQTCMSFQYQEALDLAKVAKDAAAENCLQGYHPTLAYQEIGGGARMQSYRLHSAGRGGGHLPGPGENQAGLPGTRG